MLYLHNGIVLRYLKQVQHEFYRQTDRTRNIIFIIVTQTQKDIHGLYTLIVGINHTLEDNCAIIHRPKEAK